MDKKLKDYSIWVQILTIPFTWAYMIIKVLITVPIVVVVKCNTFMYELE